MRTQFLNVGLLSMTLAGGLVSAGCSDIHTGQDKDPKGPVKLVRIMVEDDDNVAAGGLSYATDLLDTPDSPLTTAVACDPNTKPCQLQFNLNLGGASPDFSCNEMTGKCNDPLAPTGSITLQPADGAPGTVSGTEFRMVFNKQLDASKIEDITNIPGQLPGSDETYKLKDNVADIIGPDGTAIAADKYWDPAGSPTQTSDVILNPYGPAIVIKPTAGLIPGASYKVVLHTAMVTSREGDPVADQFGNVLTSDYSVAFMTGSFSLVSSTPDVTTDPTMSTPIPTDGVIQFAFNTNPGAAASVTAMPTPAIPGGTIIAYPDDELDPDTMMCVPGMQNLLDLTLVDSTTKLPMAWPAGTYSIALTVPSTNTADTSMNFTATLNVTVDATIATGMDAADGSSLSVADHPVPQQCM